MIDKQVAKKLVGRMSQLPGWPKDAQGITELVEHAGVGSRLERARG